MSSLKDLASLIMIPSLYKDGELHTVKPLADENIIVHPDATDNNDGVDGTTTPSTSSNFTFSRGSNLAATRVDVNGLIEKGRENLLLQSNQFDTTWLNQLGGTITGGQAGYDGSSDAWLISKDASNFRSVRQVISFSGVSTFSVYAKSGTLTDAALRMDTSAGAIQIVYDLSAGVVASSGGVFISNGIEDAGNGWYRIFVTANVSSGTNVHIYADRSGTTAGSIYIQDAQLEQGLVATDYIETGTSAAQSGILEDMPRLDYSGSCPSLLLEPQRSNVITQSEYIGAWTPSGLTISDNEATSPEGVSNGAKLTLPSGSAQKRIALGSMPVTSVARSYSFFVKSDDITAVQLVHSGDLQGYARFDISTGVVGSTGTKTTSDIEDYGNGWYRCIANFDSTNAFGSTIYLYISDSATGGYGGSTSAAGDLFVYGGQYEEGSYPTSYIPTYGTSQTRSQEYGRTPLETYDVNEEQGVMFAEFEYLGGTDFQVLSMHNGGSLVDWLMVDSAGKLRGSVFYNGTYKVSMDSSPTTMSPNTYYKAAFRYESGNNALYLNGVKVGTNTSTFTNPPTLGYVQLGGFWQLSNTNVNCRVKQALLFNTALTDSECIALTTL